MEKQSKAEKTTATQQRSQPSTAYHPTQSPVTKEKTTKQCNVIPKQPNVTYSPTANQTPKVYIIGDSIAKSIVHNISVKCTPSYDVIDYTKGGMTTINTNNIPVDNPKMEDIAIIVVGTNDLFKTKWENMKEAFIALFHKLQNCKQVYVVQIIKRFDIRKINNHIAKLNTCLKHLVKSHSNVKIINTNLIKYHHLNHDKLHLNNTGKNILTHLIINEVFHRQNLQNIVTDHKTDTRQSENKHNQEKNPTETRRNKVTNNQNKSTNNSTVSKRVTSRSGDNSDRGRQVSFNPRYTGYDKTTYYNSRRYTGDNRSDNEQTQTRPPHKHNYYYRQHPPKHTHCTTCSCQRKSYHSYPSNNVYQNRGGQLFQTKCEPLI
uniref:Uncharacterized protein n=1 Tax=Cacopsylla melanoneura TaxID=428564 RepID=A0A8D8SVU2_9HEMI